MAVQNSCGMRIGAVILLIFFYFTPVSTIWSKNNASKNGLVEKTGEESSPSVRSDREAAFVLFFSHRLNEIAHGIDFESNGLLIAEYHAPCVFVVWVFHDPEF